MLETDFPSLYFLVARMAYRDQVCFSVGEFVVSVELTKGFNVVNMVSASKDVTLIEGSAHGTRVIVAFSYLARDTFPVWPIVNIFPALPKPMIFSAIFSGLVLALTHHRTALAIPDPVVMLVYGERFTANDTRFLYWWFPVRVIVSRHVFRLCYTLTLLGAICGMSPVLTLCKEAGNLVRLAARSTRERCSAVCGFVLSATSGITKMFSSVYSTRGDFFGVATMGTKNSYLSHFASPVMQS